MEQLTLRGFPPELERRLRAVARARNTSLNKAALYLLGRGAGLRAPEDEPAVIGSSLDEFIGTWTVQEERQFLESVRDLDQIDEDFWK